MPCKYALWAISVLCLGARPADAEAFRLKDGTVLYGEVVSRSDSGIFIETRHLGVLRVDPGNLDCTGPAAIAASCSSERVWGDPEDRFLLLMPTAFTPPRGTFQFKDLLLYFLNLGGSPTAGTQISGGMLFPITFEYQHFTMDLKQRIWHRETESFRAALAFDGTLGRPVGDAGSAFPESYSANLLMGMRTRNSERGFRDGFGIHFLLGYMWSLQSEAGYFYRGDKVWKSEPAFGAGFESRLTRHVKFIAEYENAAPFNLYGDNERFEGFASFGLRIHGERLSADLAAIRPMTTDDLEDLLAFPLLTMAYRFGD